MDAAEHSLMRTILARVRRQPRLLSSSLLTSARESNFMSRAIIFSSSPSSSSLAGARTAWKTSSGAAVAVRSIADDPAVAAVVDHELLFELLRQPGRDLAADDIVAAARSERDDHAYGLAGYDSACD